MKIVLAIQLIIVLLMFQPDISLSDFCQNADWKTSLEQEGWSECPSDTYLIALFRNDRAPGNETVGRIELGQCCIALGLFYANQSATCINANWMTTLDG